MTLHLLAFLLLVTPIKNSPAEVFDAREWFQRGNELSRDGRFQEAVEAYQESIKLNSLSPVAHYNLGIAFKNLRQHESAVAAFKKTIELQQRSGDACQDQYDAPQQSAPARRSGHQPGPPLG